MIRFILTAAALSACACAAQPLSGPLAYADPALGTAPAEALTAWQVATGGRYPERRVSFYVGDTASDGAASFEPSPGVFAVYVDRSLPAKWRKRALLHELGHVAGLDVDPLSSDAAHWHDTTPSVMRPLIDDCADEIGAPELAAFERKYGGLE